MGIKIAVAAEGPMPGRTPTSVPSRQPIKAKRTFIGWSAMANPFNNNCRVSIALPYTPKRPTGNGAASQWTNT